MLHAIALSLLRAGSSKFPISLITGLHAEAVSMSGEATSKIVWSSPHLLSKCFIQGTIPPASRDDNLNLPIQMGILRLSFTPLQIASDPI